MVGRQHVGRVWIGAYSNPIVHIAIMGWLQVSTYHTTVDLLVTDKGDTIACPVISIDMRCSHAYKIAD